MKSYPVVDVYGVKNSQGEWFTWDEASEFEEIREYENPKIQICLITTDEHGILRLYILRVKKYKEKRA